MTTRKPKPTTVRKQQVQAFLKEPGTILDQELTERYAADVYNLTNGGILAITEDNCFRRHGKLYDSRSSFLKVLEATERQWAGKPGESSFIPARKVLKLLEDPDWSPYPALQRLDDNGTHYCHRDGRILWVSDGSIGGAPSPKNGLMYDSELVYRKQFQPQHILEELMPQGENFIQEIPQLLEALPSCLSIAPEKLDFTPTSVGKLEWAIKRLGKHNCVTPEVFPCLLAYLGEMLCRTTGAHWQMQLSFSDGHIWEPWLVMPTGHHYQIFIELYDQLYEGPLALHAIVH